MSLLCRSRFALPLVFRRYASTAGTSFTPPPGASFVPPQALENVERSRPEVQIDIPNSSTFYTTRSNFYDHIDSLESAIQHTSQILKEFHLLPLPAFARQALPPLHPMWKSKEELSNALSTKLSATRHRRMVALLNQLNDHRRIAETAGYHDFGVQIREILEMFERDDKAAQLQRGIVKKVKFDEYGRSYTLGKRKTSSARVWMISSEHATKVQRLSGNPSTLPITQIIVNNLPLNRYFVTPVDREKILRPFRLTGLIGAFNVFAIVRGGGTTGQSGAVAHGIAKALAAHVPDVEQILRKGMHIFSFSRDFSTFQLRC